MTIVDLGHETGTLVNGTPVNKASLQSGDEIRIGAFRLVVNPPDGDPLEDVGKRLTAIRDEVRGLVEEGRDADAVALVRNRAGLAPEEAKAYVSGLRKP